MVLSQELKPLNPKEPVYQFVWGSPPPLNMTFFGKMEQRRLEANKKQIENAQYARDLERGSDLIYYGVWCAVICIVAHFATSSQHMVAGKLAKVFEWGIVGGGLMIIAGAWYKKAIEFESTIAIVGIIVAGLILSHEKVRAWSLSHLFKKTTDTIGTD